jgi:hypothetical protein
MKRSAINSNYEPEKDTILYELFPTQTTLVGVDLYEILINRIIGNPRFEKYLKEIMEEQIYSYWINKIYGVIPEQDNPFDSIYLADLSPDLIGKKDIQLIKSLSNKIEDRSFLISFNDDLED